MEGIDAQDSTNAIGHSPLFPAQPLVSAAGSRRRIPLEHHVPGEFHLSTPERRDYNLS
jgi:hypothetical protein